MQPTTSILGVVLAAVSAFVIGGLWYSPTLFLTPWMKMTGVTEAQMKTRFGSGMAATAVASLLTAYILAHFIAYTAQATGVSGIAGSFVGFNYSTNNFLGLGETLSLESQLGTRMRDVNLGFTEPYFLDRDGVAQGKHMAAIVEGAQDYEYLREQGVAGIFGPGTPILTSARAVLGLIAERRKV